MLTALYVILGLVAFAFVFDGLNRRRRNNLQQSGIYPPPGTGRQSDVERLVALGHKIEAIKLYREIHGTDLKAAKGAVEEIAKRPDLRR